MWREMRDTMGVGPMFCIKLATLEKGEINE